MEKDELGDTHLNEISEKDLDFINDDRITKPEAVYKYILTLIFLETNHEKPFNFFSSELLTNKLKDELNNLEFFSNKELVLELLALDENNSVFLKIKRNNINYFYSFVLMVDENNKKNIKIFSNDTKYLEKVHG